jgi:DNA-binding XRE family transcriptional regulator
MKPFERLDDAMNRRRLELRMNWRQVAQAADISYTALRAIRRGEYRPTELTAQSLDDALQWTRGSVLAVLDGGEPTPIEAQAHTDRRVTLRESKAAATSALSPRELDALAGIAAAAAEQLGATPEEAEEAFRRALRDVEAKRSAEEAKSREEPPEESHRRHTG